MFYVQFYQRRLEHEGLVNLTVREIRKSNSDRFRRTIVCYLLLYNAQVQGASIPLGNEAEIFIIPILVGKHFFGHFRGIHFLPFEGGKEFLVHERLGHV